MDIFEDNGLIWKNVPFLLLVVTPILPHPALANEKQYTNMHQQFTLHVAWKLFGKETIQIGADKSRKSSNHFFTSREHWNAVWLLRVVGLPVLARRNLQDVAVFRRRRWRFRHGNGKNWRHDKQLSASVSPAWLRQESRNGVQPINETSRTTQLLHRSKSSLLRKIRYFCPTIYLFNYLPN